MRRRAFHALVARTDYGIACKGGDAAPLDEKRGAICEVVSEQLRLLVEHVPYRCLCLHGGGLGSSAAEAGFGLSAQVGRQQSTPRVLARLKDFVLSSSGRGNSERGGSQDPSFSAERAQLPRLSIGDHRYRCSIHTGTEIANTDTRGVAPFLGPRHGDRSRCGGRASVISDPTPDQRALLAVTPRR